MVKNKYKVTIDFLNNFQIRFLVFLYSKFPNFSYFQSYWLLSTFYLFIFRFLGMILFFPIFKFKFIYLALIFFQLMLIVIFYLNKNLFVIFYKCGLKLTAEFYFFSLVYWRFVLIYTTGIYHLSIITGISVSLMYFFFGSLLPWLAIIFLDVNSYIRLFFFFFKFLPIFIARSACHERVNKIIDKTFYDHDMDHRKFYQLNLRFRSFKKERFFSLIETTMLVNYGQNRRLKKFWYWERLPVLVNNKYDFTRKRGILHVFKDRISTTFNIDQSSPLTGSSVLKKAYLIGTKKVHLDWSRLFVVWTSDLIFTLVFMLVFLVLKNLPF